MNRVVERTLTGTLLALIAAGFLTLNRYAPTGYVPWFAAVVLSLLAGAELARMGRLTDYRLGRSVRAAAGAMAILTLGLAVREPPPAWMFVLLASLALLAALLASRGHEPVWALGSALWAGVPLFGLVWIAHEFGTPGLVALVVLSKIGDVFGYFVGRAIGKSHPFPGLSPGKTTAGCVASLVAGTVAGVLAVQFGWLAQGSFGLWAGALAGAGTNLAAQTGDLLESWFKRRAGVKDSGTLAGASGGVLDVVDSLLLTVPFALLVWPVLGL